MISTKAIDRPVWNSFLTKNLCLSCQKLCLNPALHNVLWIAVLGKPRWFNWGRLQQKGNLYTFWTQIDSYATLVSLQDTGNINIQRLQTNLRNAGQAYNYQSMFYSLYYFSVEAVFRLETNYLVENYDLDTLFKTCVTSYDDPLPL